MLVLGRPRYLVHSQTLLNLFLITSYVTVCVLRWPGSAHQVLRQILEE